jgi:16S rRNA (cytidine1402-2'-O)-methyltransferase
MNFPIIEQQVTPSTLYLVPTPIGHLADFTLRAIEILRTVDLVACEDTRTSARLFEYFDIQTKKTSFHAHNEHKKVASLVENMRTGMSVALVSDAGSPGISDPGFLLVRATLAAGLPVVPLPGPTALVPALTASGLPTDRFVFEGFLPPKKGRMNRLRELVDNPRTIVFYEAPHRLAKLLGQIVDVFGEDRFVVIAREVTKKFEEFSRGTAAEQLERISGLDRVRGEIVVMVAGASYDASSLSSVVSG